MIILLAKAYLYSSIKGFMLPEIGFLVKMEGLWTSYTLANSKKVYLFIIESKWSVPKAQVKTQRNKQLASAI